MDVVRLMGKEVRDYTVVATGELKTFCGLHVVYEQSDNAEVQGKKCDNFSCPREVDGKSLQIGQCYELAYSHFQTKNGLAARISGLKPVDVK